MLSIQLCGVRPENPCCIILLAKFTPHNSSAGPVRGMAARRVSQAAPRCRRCPPEPSPRPSVRQLASTLPASGGRPAHGAPSGITRARTLALRPGTGRAGTVADSAPTQLQDASRPVGLGARKGPGAAASEAGPGSRTGHESGLYVLASEAAGERKERCRPPRQGAPLGVPGPGAERSPATVTLAGLGRQAPRPAPPEPPSCSLHGRCGDDQVGARDYGPGPAGGSRAVDLETERAAGRPAGTSAAGGQPGRTFAGREAR